jgi:hypothetical protein
MMNSTNKTTIKVLHREIEDPNERVHVANIHMRIDHLDPAPSTEAILEMAFRLTQNIEGSWSRGPLFETGEENHDFDDRIELVAPLRVDTNGKTWGHRSSMVFDEFVLNGEVHRVRTFGFELVQPETV